VTSDRDFYYGENIMKRVKICALALSACLAAGAMAGCKKTEETTEPSGSVLDTVTSGSSSEAETAESTSQVVTSESSSEAASEDTSASSESKVTSGDTQATSGDNSNVALDADQQEYANTFITNFAEQFFWDFDSSTAELDRYMDFVYIHLKINAQSEVSTAKNGDVSYEMFSAEKAQAVIGKYFGKGVKDEDIKKLHTPPEAYGDSAAGPYYKDGKIWYQPGAGESYNRIGIVEAIKNNGDGTLTLKFTVYEIDLDTFATLNSSGLKEYYKLTPAKASMDKTLKKVSYGSAVVDVSQSGTYLLKSYDVA
jgi:hypothetical protein